MRAVDRTCKLFQASVTQALPDARLSVVRSRNSYGRSNYVYIHLHRRILKVRISDHPVGMRRALSGECQLFISAGARPASWSVWLSELAAPGRRGAADLFGQNPVD